MIRFLGTERATDRTKVYLGEAWQKNICRRFFRFAFAALIIGALFGCGGGSGDGSPSGSSDGGGQINDGPKDISLSSDSVAFFHTPSGPDPAPQTLTASFSGDGLLIGYPPEVEEPSWLRVERVDETDNSSPVEIRLTAYPHFLGDQSVQSTVRFVTGNLDGSNVSYRDLSVSCSARGLVSLERSELSFSYINGAALPASQTVGVIGANTNWSVSADQSWLTVSPASGSGSGSLEIAIAPEGLTSGVYNATVTVENTATGETLPLAVDLSIEPHMLFVGDNGVALSSFPSAPSVLENTLTVTDNADLPTAWTAQSDQSWLSVTPAGTTDGPLTLAADPAGLATETIHYATITLNSDDATIEGTEQIRVGLYVAAADPTATELPIAGHHLVADPIRPYVYVTYTDYLEAATDPVLDTFHIYTGQKVHSMTAGGRLKAMAISSDGQALYISDDSDDTIVPVELTTMATGPKWQAACFGGETDNLAFTRFNGQPVVLTSQHQVFSATDGTLVAELPTQGGNNPSQCFDSLVLAATPDGKSIYGIWPGVSGYLDLQRFAGDYSAVNDRFNTTKTHTSNRPYGNVQDIAINADGSRIYIASGAENYFSAFAFDGSTLEKLPDLPLGGGIYPGSVTVGAGGTLYGGVYGFNNTKDIWSYNTAGTLEDGYSVAGRLHARQLEISGDGLRLISLSYDSTNETPALTFTPLTP